MSVRHFERDLAAGVAATTDAARLALLAREQIAPIDDAVALLARWHGFSEAARAEAERPSPAPASPSSPEPFGDDAPALPVRNTLRHVGRNDCCPCGSGAKYKRCCLLAA